MLDDVQQALLRDMLDSACAIRRYLAGVTREVFLNDVEKQDAVLRRFEIIGEAASRLSPDTQALFPGVPPFAPCVECAISLPTTTATWISTRYGRPPHETCPN